MFLYDGVNICDLFSLAPYYLPIFMSLIEGIDERKLTVVRVIRFVKMGICSAFYENSFAFYEHSFAFYEHSLKKDLF